MREVNPRVGSILRKQASEKSSRRQPVLDGSNGQGQTILREALLVADHNAYHLGQLIVVRRLLGAWPE
ncbi:MAG TPA: hypothetical protein VNX28_04195 [Gemmataceae bacterium]|nr:hypothetical protein [Gemmataceae bacterium]